LSDKPTPQVELFDTSLRDGLQQPDLAISVANAISLLQRMSAFGVRYAEIGFAGATRFVSDLTAALESADTGPIRLALFGRSRGRGVTVHDWPDLQFILAHKSRIPAAVIVVKSRLLDVAKSLETTPEENLRMVYETVDHLQQNGLEVLVDLEHAMDAACARRENGAPCDPDLAAQSLDYFHRLVAQCVRQQVSRIVVCDTNGGANPEEVSHLIASLIAAHPSARFGFHGHQDRGLGIANTRAAILAGAVHVQGTLLGTGERCGNVNLTTVTGAMQLRGEAQFVPPAALAGLTSLAHSAYAAFGLEPPHGAPIVGPGAFGTWAGMHGSSERKNPGAYLWCDPALVGASPAIGVNAQSGRANIVLLSETLGVPLTSAQAQTLMDRNPAMIEGGGYTASEVSFRLACMRVLGTLPDWFSVRSWRIFDESDEIGNHYAIAFMTLLLGPEADAQTSNEREVLKGHEFTRAVNAAITDSALAAEGSSSSAARLATTRAEGAGPVDALTKAMRRELEKPFPALAEMRLGTFTVTALDISAHDSAAHVRVTASFNADGHEPWVTAGVSSDLNQAALNAIVDGFHHWLLKRTEILDK